MRQEKHGRETLYGSVPMTVSYQCQLSLLVINNKLLLTSSLLLLCVILKVLFSYRHAKRLRVISH